MDYLQQLLNNQPVEWKKLGEVAELVRGNGLSKKDFAPEGIPAIHYGQIYTYYGNETKETISFVTPETASKLRKVFCGNVVITNTSENLEDVGKALLYTGKSEAVTGGHATIIRCSEHLLPKFFVYYTKTRRFFDQKRKLAKGTKVIDVSATDLARIEIPIPPLSVQSRIVEILDKFTAMEAELEEQLQAELELRKKQYAYYREQLLNFSYTPPSEFNVVYRKLGEVAQYSKGRIDASTLNSKNYVGVDNLLQDCQGKKLSEHVPTEGRCTAYSPKDILIGNIRPYLKKIWFADNTGGTNGDVLVIQATDERVLPEYLYQVLSEDAFFKYDMQHAKGAKMPRGSKDKILDYKIPIPPLSEQQRIVEILDKFDTLTNSISEGLPLEIKLRRQQYEYYREQLLAFPHP